MIVFWLIAAGLILAAYLLFWWTLRRPPRLDTQIDLQANLTAHRQRRRELEQERAEGKIDQAQYEQLLAELDRDLLDLSEKHNRGKSRPPYHGIVPVFLALGLIPLAAMMLYFSLGRPDLLNPRAIPQAQKNAPPSLEEAIAKIERRLQDNPNDLEGWVLLARSYQATGRIDKALAAYRKALALAPDNPDLEVRYAEALAQSKGGDLSGEPLTIIRKVLETHPDHPYALWLAGMAALHAGDRDSAQRYWNKLLAQMPPGSQPYRQLTAMMQKAGLQVPQSSAPQPAAGGASVQVTVRLSPELAARAKPDDPVYVFAKAASGPPMPLAIVRKQVRDLPLTVTLDDSMAMMPQLKLSRFPKVIIGARVAKSGNAQGAPGDLEGQSTPAAVSGHPRVELVIDQVRS
ncbi:cytochrome c-type biogenesis protein CcmH [Methylomarinovum caldicuralii]|uniref:Cytochrome c-type biogenesis protein CcmH n=1 Tax=Methylomarinovum caldicuralii TaxID=438856 RepID=A0AAU9CQJ3_9GAMM|nr:c-type cytochrome biogenesis protein CcmI [Methylomarinovum caldicuralii]BCX82223.1 cytochrome c-type biogenesis protein CcmH [Methylomarinovum caldicuralii]